LASLKEAKLKINNLLTLPLSFLLKVANYVSKWNNVALIVFAAISLIQIQNMLVYAVKQEF
jgi:hypothetical protein